MKKLQEFKSRKGILPLITSFLKYINLNWYYTFEFLSFLLKFLGERIKTLNFPLPTYDIKLILLGFCTVLVLIGLWVLKLKFKKEILILKEQFLSLMFKKETPFIFLGTGIWLPSFSLVCIEILSKMFKNLIGFDGLMYFNMSFIPLFWLFGIYLLVVNPNKHVSEKQIQSLISNTLILVGYVLPLIISYHLRLLNAPFMALLYFSFVCYLTFFFSQKK